MKSFSFAAVVAVAALLTGGPLFAQHDHNKASPKTETPAGAGKLVRVTQKEAAWAAKARETYPLAVCVVADEKLGGMGEAAAYAYRVAGQPDRLVLFCCSGCEEDFMQEPAKFLAKLDAAAKGKPAPAKKTGAASEHGEHRHE